MSVRLGTVAALAWLVLIAAAPSEPDGYRMNDYRSPTPASLHGAEVIGTDQACALWHAKSATFVDVLPQAPKPTNLPANTIWREKPRDDIPGSIWLPDTGYGTLAPAMEAYFAAGLARVSDGRKDSTLVFYCLPDCWMSWNAAKRALALGYSHVDWYPEGTEGWQNAGLPLERRAPEPRPAP